MLHYGIKMVNKQNYKLQLWITLPNKAITVKLENNKVEIIQSLKHEVSLLQNRVGKIESQVCLLEDALINNDIKISNADQYSR